jgi:uncharacterized membrane protein YbhN (UPF0104 family)
MKTAIRIVVTIAGFAAVGLAARHLDVRSVFDSIRGVDPLLGLAAALVMIIAKVGAKVMRSQILLDATCAKIGHPPPRRWTTARLLAASHAAGQLAWGPLGFTVRTIALRDDGMPLPAIARVHVAERIAEALGIAAIALVALALAPAAILGSWFGRILLVALAAIPVALVSSRVRARLRDAGGALARAAVWAHISSIADVLVLVLAARGMHVYVDLPTALLAFLAINGACALPVTPAQLGVQEAAIVAAFAAGGIPAPHALAAALAYRAAHVVPLAIVGLPALIATWGRFSASRSTDVAPAAAR